VTFRREKQEEPPKVVEKAKAAFLRYRLLRKCLDFTAFKLSSLLLPAPKNNSPSAAIRSGSNARASDAVVVLIGPTPCFFARRLRRCHHRLSRSRDHVCIFTSCLPPGEGREMELLVFNARNRANTEMSPFDAKGRKARFSACRLTDGCLK
jgi:hypothetical protein